MEDGRVWQVLNNQSHTKYDWNEGILKMQWHRLHSQTRYDHNEEGNPQPDEIWSQWRRKSAARRVIITTKKEIPKNLGIEAPDSNQSTMKNEGAIIWRSNREVSSPSQCIEKPNNFGVFSLSPFCSGFTLKIYIENGKKLRFLGRSTFVIFRKQEN